MPNGLMFSFRRVSRILGISAVLFVFICVASAQRLSFTPGIVQFPIGDTTGKQPLSPANYTGSVSGLVLNQPTAILFDKNGNLFIADGGSVGDNSIVLRVIASGNGPIPSLPSVQSPTAQTVYQIGGTGNGTVDPACTAPADAAGDNCLATQADLSAVSVGEISLDAAGNVYLLDTNNDVVRVISAGSKLPGLINPKAGFVYVFAGTFQNSGYSGDDGLATSATLSLQPPSSGIGVSGIGTDAENNVYIADASNYVVRVVYAGGSVPGLPSKPVTGDIYTIAGGGRGRECPALTDRCGDDGPATESELYDPSSATVDSFGNIYVADGNRLRVIYANGTVPGLSNPVPGYIYTVFGNGTVPSTTQNGLPALTSSVAIPYEVVIDSNQNIYTATFNPPNSGIFKIDPSGTLWEAYGNLGFYQTTCTELMEGQVSGCPANQVHEPTGASALALDPAGTLYTVIPGPYLIAQVNGSESALTYGNQGVGSFSDRQIVDVENTGSSSLTFEGLTVAGPFVQQAADGGDPDCSASTTLPPGGSCEIAIAFAPTETGSSLPGTVTIASSATNATSGANTISLTGTGVTATSPAATTATLSVSPSFVPISKSVSLTATITTTGTTTPTGAVVFSNGGAQIGTASLDSLGVASFTSDSLPSGSYNVTAVYEGDANSLASTSNAVQFVVQSQNTAATVTTLTSASTSFSSGASVLLTATVSSPAGGMPTGTITFMNGPNPLGTVPLNAQSSSSFQTNFFVPGVDAITAVYSGDSNFLQSTSLVLPINISNPGSGASLAFAPGLAETAFGDVTGNLPLPPTNYTGASSGLALSNPQSAVFDSNGNLYILDDGGRIVRVVASGNGPIPSLPSVKNPIAGSVYLIAGGGSGCGNDCPATSASFVSHNAGLALDSGGNVYIADFGGEIGHTVWVVYGGGTVPAGLPNNLVAGNIYAVAGNGQNGDGGEGGPATSPNAYVGDPEGIAVDQNGNIYIAEFNQGLLNVVYGGGTTLGTILGISNPTVGYLYTVSSNFQNPQNVAVDASGNIYVSDRGAGTLNAIYVSAGSTLPGISSPVVGNTYVIAGNGSAASVQNGVTASMAPIGKPYQIAFDPAGDIYLPDKSDNLIFKIDTSGILTTVFGGAAPCSSSTDSFGDGCTATNATLNQPESVAFEPGVGLFVADTGDNLVRNEINSSTSLTLTSPSIGTASSQQVLSVSNTGSAQLVFSGSNVSTSFAQTPSGGTDCSASITLAPGASCQIGIVFTPSQGNTTNGSVTISSNSNNAVGGTNQIQLVGIGPTQFLTSTTLTSSATSISPGQSITLTAAVSVTTGTGSPTGTVQFFDGITSLGTVSLTNGSATLMTSALTAGSNSLTAVYSGDTNFEGSTSSAVVVTDLPATTTTLAATPTTVAAGGSVNLFAEVLPAAATGTVNFFIGNSTTLFATATLSNGLATYTTKTLQVGSDSITAVYSGSSSFAGSTSQAFLVTVNSGTAATTTTLTATPPTPTYGQPVTLTANVASSGTGTTGTPTGTVTFMSSGTSLGMATLASGSGSLAISTLPLGTDSISAVYSGDAAFATSTSSPVPVVVNAQTTTTTLTVTPTAALTGQNVVLSASVAPTSATGNVVFMNNGTSIGTASLTGGVAQLTTNTLSAGNYSITAVYQGSGNYAGSTSTAVSLTITQAAAFTSTALTASATTATPGQSVSFTATVSSASGIPTDIVNFVIGGNTVGTGTLVAVAGSASSASASYSTTLPLGTSSITAVYPGAAGFQGSTSSAVLVTVANPVQGSTTTLAASAATITFGGTETLTATVASATTGSTTIPTGTVTFQVISAQFGTTTLGTGTLNAQGVATLGTPNLPTGTDEIFASYGGDSNFSPSVSTPPTQVIVNPAVPSISMTASPASLTIKSGQSGSAALSLTAVNGFSGTLSLSCGSLPAGVTCTFTPSVMNVSGDVPTQATLTINTNGLAQLDSPFASKGSPMLALTLLTPGTLGLLFAFAGRRRRRTNSTQRWSLFLVGALMLGGLAGLTACVGGSSSSLNAQPGTASVVVTAQSTTSAVTQSLNLNLTIQ